MASDVPIASNVVNEGALAQALNMVGNRPADHRTVLNLRQAVDGVQHPAGPSHTNIGDMNTHGRTTAADRRVTNNGLLSEYVPVNMTEEQQLRAAMSANEHDNASDGLTEEEMLEIALMESQSGAGGGQGQLLTEEELNSKMPGAPAKQSAAPPYYTTPVDNKTNAEDDDTPMVIVNTRIHIAQNRRNNRASMSKRERKRHVTVIDALSRPRNTTYVNELDGIADRPTPERAQEMMDFAEDMEED